MGKVYSTYKTDFTRQITICIHTINILNMCNGLKFVKRLGETNCQEISKKQKSYIFNRYLKCIKYWYCSNIKECHAIKREMA